MCLFFLSIWACRLFPRTIHALAVRLSAQISRRKFSVQKKTIKVYNNHLFTANYAPLITASIPHAPQLRTHLPKKQPQRYCRSFRKNIFLHSSKATTL